MSADKVSKIAVSILLASGIVLPEVLGYLSVNYSSSANFISELGAMGAPFAQTANYFGFLSVGLAVIALIIVLWSSLPQNRLVKSGLVCLVGIAAGYLGAFLFPCDAGCPATGSSQQSLHNLAGLLEYVGGIGGLLLLYFGLRKNQPRTYSLVTLAVACAVMLGLVLMSQPDLQPIRGAAQRLADYTMFIWLSAAALTSTSAISLAEKQQ